MTAPPVMTSEVVAAALRAAILRGELLPGEHVRQEVWAERLGISRVPVREALKMLHAQRILTHDANRGYFVAKMSMSDLAQVYRIRLFLEPAVLESIAWPDQETYAHLVATVDRLIDAARASRIEASMQEERIFFFTLYDLSPLDVFVAEAKHFWDLSDPYRLAALATRRMVDPEATTLSKRRHAMLDAIAAHDRERLVAELIEERRSLVASFEAQAGAHLDEGSLKTTGVR